MKASLTEPFDHTDPIYIYDCCSTIIASLLALPIDRRIVPCSHIVIRICLDMSMHLLYDIHLIIECMSYMINDGVF
jgi:hypothetical protein